MEKLIHEAVLIKSQVVQQDEKERGERKKLNFGHTFAHAIERKTGILHGEAVSIGMVLAAKLSVKLGFLRQSESDRVSRILSNLKLPVNLDIECRALVSDMKKDKKREGDFLHMVFLSHIGNAIIEKLSFNQLERLSYDLC
jgi:3-dehydroquinate synthase